MGGATLRPWSERQWEKSFAAALSALPGHSDSDDTAQDVDSSDSDGDSEPGDAPAPAAVPVGRDGIAASASAHELALARELAKDPWGRFGGREGKMARIAAAEAAHAAAVGDAAHQTHLSKRQRAAQQAAAAAAEAAAEAARIAEAAVPYPPPSKGTTKRARDGGDVRHQGADKKSRRAAPTDADITPAPAAVKDASPAQHWWSSIFHFAGALEGALHRRPDARAGVDGRPAFTGTEAEQIALCDAAHAHKASGRRGLGQGRRDAESEWQGTRVVFDDPDPSPVDGDNAAHDEALARVKWKKVAASVLASHPQGMLSEKKLRRATIAAVTEALGHQCAARGTLRAWFERRVLKSSRFARTECGRVQLAGSSVT